MISVFSFIQPIIALLCLLGLSFTMLLVFAGSFLYSGFCWYSDPRKKFLICPQDFFFQDLEANTHALEKHTSNSIVSPFELDRDWEGKNDESRI